MSAKILLVDLETAPILGYTWATYDTNVIEMVRPVYILSFAWKWFGEEDQIEVLGLCDYQGFKKDKSDDAALVKDLWNVVNSADILVAQNGDAFDIKVANARFVAHDLPPPKPYKTVDTLKLARKHFKFGSNKLTDLGSYLGVGTKLTHAGWALWKGCMAGDTESWAKMKEYNVQDVALLEQIYIKLRPWATSHPNLNLYSDHEGCTHCGSMNVQRRGFNYAKVQVRQRFQCNDCRGWFSGKTVKVPK